MQKEVGDSEQTTTMWLNTTSQNLFSSCVQFSWKIILDVEMVMIYWFQIVTFKIVKSSANFYVQQHINVVFLDLSHFNAFAVLIHLQN